MAEETKNGDIIPTAANELIPELGFAMTEETKNSDVSPTAKVDEKIDDDHELIRKLGIDLSVSCLVRCPRADHGAIALLNKSFRSLLKSGYLSQQRRLLGIAEYWIYFSCTMLLSWEAFDPDRSRWISLPKVDAEYTFTHSSKESQAVGTQLLVFGKEISRQIIYKYDLLTNSWHSGMMLSHQRTLFASASQGNIAIFAGGSDFRTGAAVGFVELYDSETGTWRELPSLSIPRKLCDGLFMDGKFYVIGGLGEGTTDFVKTAEVYDLKTDTWSKIPDMCPVSASVRVPPLLAVVKNELYAAVYEQLELLKYSKEANSWKKIGDLPFRVPSMYRWGIAFKACGDRLVVIGELGCSGSRFLEIVGWEPADGAVPVWSLLGRKRCENRFVYNSAVMGC